jgi:hypothetical protein
MVRNPRATLLDWLCIISEPAVTNPIVCSNVLPIAPIAELVLDSAVDTSVLETA